MACQNEILVFNIQRYSLHDGEGIRTVVFLKGCPLRCRWCCNPESQKACPELIYQRSRCIGRNVCGLCQKSAPSGVISYSADGKAAVDFGRVGKDLSWTRCCPSQALGIEGKKMPVSDILDIVEQDASFYRHGQGGVTLSGGEPLMQENTLPLLRQAKERRLHTSVETCGYVDRKRLLEAAGYLDEMFYDIKTLNEEKHCAYTGVSNRRIIDNLISLCQNYPDKKITVRTPVIPGFNDNEEELKKIEVFLQTFPDLKWEKLPYHTYGLGKYEMLGRKYMLECSDYTSYT